MCVTKESGQSNSIIPQDQDRAEPPISAAWWTKQRLISTSAVWRKNQTTSINLKSATRTLESAATEHQSVAKMTPTMITRTVRAMPQRNAATNMVTTTNTKRTSLSTTIAHATMKNTAAQMNVALKLNAAKGTNGQRILTARHRLVTADWNAASKNRSLTPTPPTPCTARVFPKSMDVAVYLRTMKHTWLTPSVQSATLAKNAALVILSPKTGTVNATILNFAAALKVTNGRIIQSALAIQDVNAAQGTLSRLTPNGVRVIQKRSAAQK